MQIANVDLTDDENNNKEDRLYTNFIYSIKSEVSRQVYLKCLKYYVKFLGVKSLRELVDTKNKSQKIIESNIKAFWYISETKKKISYNTTSLYLSAIRKFYYVNSD